MASVVDSDVFTFADGNGGHVCTLSGAPSAGQWDLLFVNSNTVVSTPSGFTSEDDEVTNQGAYIFSRKAAGSEGSTVAVSTSGNFNTEVIWVRVGGANAVDVAAGAQTNSNPGGVTSPAFSSGALAESGEIAFAFCALHAIATAVPTDAGWSSGYTTLESAAIGGTAGDAVAGFVAVKTSAGTAAEAPTFSVSPGSASNRYLLFISLTNGAITPVTGDGTGTFGALTGSGAGDVTIYGSAAANLPALQGSGAGTVVNPAVVGATPGTPGWYGLLNIAEEAARLYEEDRDRALVACPFDGEPLRAAPGGGLYCPFDGYRTE